MWMKYLQIPQACIVVLYSRRKAFAWHSLS
uniref:Uncharacterized protein n=1 Tax=Anguilla anguilla TaxID=7936 RepID=A0A0E9T4G4_ANGAN